MKRTNIILWLLTAGALLLALSLAFDWLPFLRGGYGWVWTRALVAPERALVLAGAFAAYLLGGWALLTRARARWALAWAFVGAVLLPLAVIWLRFDDVLWVLMARTLSPHVTGPHYVAATLDWGGVNWLDWVGVMRLIEPVARHPGLAPPGLPLFYHSLIALADALPAAARSLGDALAAAQCHNAAMLRYTPGAWAAAWFGVLTPLLAALTVFPLYGITRRAVGDVAGRQAALGWALVPAALLFAPGWNTLFPLGTLLTLDLLLRGMERRPLLLVCAGLLAGLLTFANFSMPPLLVLCGFTALLHTLLNERRDLHWTRPLVVGAWFGGGAALPWALWMLAGGSSPLAMLQTAFSMHYELDRPYVPWLWLHTWDWALFAGVPLVLLWVGASVARLRQWRTPGSVLALALFATVVVMVFSGTARGETARVWMFFTPLMLLGAADALTRLRASPRAWALVTAGGAAVTLALAGTLDVIGVLDLSRPPVFDAPAAAAHPANAVFSSTGQGALLALDGWDAAGDGQGIALTLHVRALQRIYRPQDILFTVLPVAPDGAALPPVTWLPGQESGTLRSSATCWQPGVPYALTMRVPLPDDAAAGDWWLSFSLLGDPTHPENRLLVTLPDGTQDRQVGIGGIPLRP